MGSGKSTVGRRLADHVDATFVDLDTRIEFVFGRSISSLFEDGEEDFRRCERAALESLAAEPAFRARPVVVATGGGVVIDRANLGTMRAAGVTVFIDVPAQELARRLTTQGRSERPLLTHGDPATTLARLFAQRRDAYQACDVTVDGVGEPDAVVSRIDAGLRAVGWPQEVVTA